MAQNGSPVVDATGPAVIPVVSLYTVQEQVQRILSDPLFHNSKRYSDMLKFIVDRTLDGHHECLKERIIGIEVFDRPPDYDTGVDSIVRVAAAEVRKRLSRYYHESRHDQELRIELPIRSYVAEFKLPEQVVRQQPVGGEQPVSRERPVPAEQPLPLQETSSRPQRRFWSSNLLYILIAVAASVLVVAGWGLKRVSAPTQALNRFWAPMLNNSGTTLITIGSPIWIKLSPVVASASSVAPEPGIPFDEFITHQINFPMADLSAASAMTSFLARRGRDSVIRLSDSTTLSDLHRSPLIVFGSFPNEWALRLGASLPFQFQRDAGSQWIEDTSHPADRKWMIEMHSPYEQVTSEYVLITRATDPTTGQWWIGIGGVTVMGTIAAQPIMTDPKEVAAITARLPNGWEHKNLQFVVGIKMVKGSPGAAQVLAARTW